MTKLYAQPYDISASGFYFETIEEYHEKAEACRNSSYWPVEEFSIQLIDGNAIDASLFQALAIHQGTIQDFLKAVENWSDEEKIKVIIALEELGYEFNLCRDEPDQLDIDLYEIDSLRELAIEFVEEGLFGEIPESIRPYIDYEAVARDLAMDYGEIIIDGTHYVYRGN